MSKKENKSADVVCIASRGKEPGLEKGKFETPQERVSKREKIERERLLKEMRKASKNKML